MPSKQEVLAVVLARSGSKGIKHKNIRDFAGFPLMVYSIAAALQAKRVTRVILTTDSPEYAEIGREYGAEVPFIRPDHLSGDDVPDLPVFQHALDYMGGFAPDLVVHLRPTTPLRYPGMIDAAIEVMGLWDTSLRGVIEAPYPPHKCYSSNGYLKPLPLDAGDLPEPHNQPRQLLPKTYFHTGQLDIVRPATIFGGSMSGEKIQRFDLRPEYAVDLDDEQDWRMAEWIVTHTGLDIIRPR